MKKGSQVRLICNGLFFLAFSVVFFQAPYHAAAATPQVATGLFHNVALAVDGTVWTWGSNINGQLCAPDRQTQDPVPRPIPGLTDVIQVAAGGNFTLALKSDGTIWACGDNKYGQLGRNFVSGTNPQPNIWPIMDPTDPSFDFSLDAAGDIPARHSHRIGEIGAQRLNLNL